MCAWPRTAAEWNAPPGFPASHYVDSRVYTDDAIFGEEGEGKIFKPLVDHRVTLSRMLAASLFSLPCWVTWLIIYNNNTNDLHYYHLLLCTLV